MEAKMIYELIKQVKENGIGADGTVVCSMDELVALVDYIEEEAYDDGYGDGYDQGYDEAYHEYCEDEEDGYKLGYAKGYKMGYNDGCEDNCENEDEEPTLEDLFKEWVAARITKGR